MPLASIATAAPQAAATAPKTGPGTLPAGAGATVAAGGVKWRPRARRWPREGSSGLAAEVDLPVRLNRVAALEVVRPAVLRHVHREALRLPDPCRRARHGREDRVLQCGDAAVRPAVRLHRRDDLPVAHRERPAALHDLVGDRRAHYLHPLAHQWGQARRRPAELAREGVEDRL